MEAVMNLKPILITSALIAAAASPIAQAEPATYAIDRDHFSIAFFVEHIGYQDQAGMFLEASGEFVYDESANTLQSGEVIIQADSVFTNHDRRDRHLRGDDFLDSGEHETIRFTAEDWQPDSDGQGTLTGQLTLLGETRPVSLDVTLNKSAPYPFGHKQPTLGLSAHTTIRRSEWGMTYGVEDDLVGDEVELRFEFEAIRQ
jgi:polyisoprenoid-binding protein YceI